MNSEIVSCATSASRRARGCMYASSLLQGMVFFGPIATLYRQARGISIVQLSVIEAVCLILAIALEIPWGIIADRIGYKRTLVVCALLGVTSKVIFWQAHSFGMFLTERIVLAVVMAGTSGVDVAYLSAFVPDSERQKVFGRYEACGMVGLMAASIIFSVYVKDRYDLSAFLTVLSYAGALFCILLAPREDAPAKTKSAERPLPTTPPKIGFGGVVAALSRSRAFLPVLLSSVLLAGVNQTVTVFIVQLRYVQIGMSAWLMGVAYILLTLSAMSGAWLSHCGCKLLGERGMQLGTSIVALCSCLLLASSCASPLAVIAAVCLLRLSASMQVPLRMEMESRFSPADIRATMLSCYAIILDCAEIGTSLVFGSLADIQVRYALSAGAVCCVISVLCVLLVSKRSWIWRK